MKKQIKTRQIRSKAMSIYNALIKIRNTDSEGRTAPGHVWYTGDAMKQAWLVAKAWAAMHQDEIVIRFCKQDEEIPEQRTGTLSAAFFSYTNTSTKARKENPLQVPFWDTCKNGWRSFNAARFVSFASAPLPF